MNKYIPLPDEMTIRESYSPAMEMTSQQDADEYLAALIERNVRCFGQTEEKSRRIELSNIGYYAGYYDEATRERVYSLFGTVHPLGIC